MTRSTHDRDRNVIDLFAKRGSRDVEQHRFVRLSPEYDGISMLYSNTRSKNTLYTMKVLCWGLRANGEVVGLVPWLNKAVPCPSLANPISGEWEGYYDPETDDIFDKPPAYKVTELKQSASYFSHPDSEPADVIQEIPDTIGTHALLDSDDHHSLILTEVLSWRLLASGKLQAMLINAKKVVETPVLPGDPCLYPAEENPNFRYFFQHHIANQIKAENPDALAAIAMLFDN